MSTSKRAISLASQLGMFRDVTEYPVENREQCQISIRTSASHIGNNWWDWLLSNGDRDQQIGKGKNETMNKVQPKVIVFKIMLVLIKLFSYFLHH